MPAEITLYKRNLIVTSEEYQIILDSLELMESSIMAKIKRCKDKNEVVKLNEYHVTVQEMLTDLAE